MEYIHNIVGFDWDEYNSQKNWLKHSVEWAECEEVFFNQPFIVKYDEKHSQNEDRFFSLGRTSKNRYLFVVFTIRNSRIRIISARDMSKKERIEYEKHT